MTKVPHAPKTAKLTPKGGLPTGNWEDHELVEYIRKDLASSPDLLAAAKAMKSVWVSVCGALGHDPNHMQQFVDLCAAIAKAEGRA